jgi:hypothetical protein
MRITNLQSLGDPGTFDLTDKDDPQYYIARFSHECSQNLYALQQAGFTFEQPEAADFTAIETDMTTWIDAVGTWMGSAVLASESGLPVPVEPAPPAIPPKTLPGLIISIVLKIAVRAGIKWLGKKLDPDTNTDELAKILRKSFLEGEGVDEYALIKGISNLPIRIIISKNDDYQDFLYGSD